MSLAYVVVKPEIAGNVEGGFNDEYYSDLVEHPTRKEAIRHGWKLYGHDDWLVLALDDGQPHHLSWMHEVRDDPDELADVAAALYLPASQRGRGVPRTQGAGRAVPQGVPHTPPAEGPGETQGQWDVLTKGERMTIVEDRLAALNDLVLKKGKHASWDEGACVLEAVSYIAGEPWERPSEVRLSCPDRLLHGLERLDERRGMYGLSFCRSPRLVGTRVGEEVESARAWMATDWMVRVHTPAWLRLAGLNDQAAALEELPELVQADQVPSIKPVLEAVRKDAAAAGDAARAAAGDAAGAAARAAAWDAARAAARDAAPAAAGDAAWAAARAAARAAAWAAARAALRPTVVELQASALELLDRMVSAAPIAEATR